MIAPSVPAAESRPTNEPLVATSTIVARTTIGAIADSVVAGSPNPIAASSTIAPTPLPRPAAPSASTTGTDAIAPNPPRMNVGPSRPIGPYRSAARPPTHAPMAIPARITPMIPVYVVSDTPT